MKSMLRAVVARLLIVTMSSTIVPGAEGAVIGTDAAINPDRERILMLLDHPDVAAHLKRQATDQPRIVLAGATDIAGTVQEQAVREKSRIVLPGGATPPRHEPPHQHGPSCNH